MKVAPSSGGLSADCEEGVVEGVPSVEERGGIEVEGVPSVEERGNFEGEKGEKGEKARLVKAMAFCDTVVVKLGQLSWAAHGANNICKLPCETMSTDVRQILAIVCLIIEGCDSLCWDIEGAFRAIC